MKIILTESPTEEKRIKKYYRGAKVLSRADDIFETVKLLDKDIDLIVAPLQFRALCRHHEFWPYHKDYDLIIDGQVKLFSTQKLNVQDFETLIEYYCDYNQATHQLIWRKERQDYYGVFSDEKSCALYGGLYYKEETQYRVYSPLNFKRFKSVTVINNYLLCRILDAYDINHNSIDLPVNPQLIHIECKSQHKKCITYKEKKLLWNEYFKDFFRYHNVEINTNQYALSEMLQWIWRSAIRDGKEIWIYIPSRRMRELLQNWIQEISGNIPKIIN